MEQKNKEYEQGIALAILCALIWGFLPIYWKSLEPINPLLILCYRIVLSFVFALILALIFYKWENIKKPLKEKKILLTFLIAGILVTINWGTYIWAVNNGHLIQTSIGYFIEPLIVCVFGITFFKERLNRYKLTAFILACAGVAAMLIYHHKIPAIALVLAISFASYAAIKKKLKLEAVLAQIYETMFMMPFALIAILYFEISGKGALENGSHVQWALLALAGIMTCTPLMLFSMAANRINLITLGVSQYLSPTMALLFGIFLYHEPFDKIQFTTIAFIWAGLIIFTVGELKEKKLLTTEKNINTID